MPPTEPDTTPAPDAEQLATLIHGLWRSVVRAARVQENLSPLPQSQVVLLRRLLADGPMTPAQLAEALHLARPTISNLVRELTEAGLLERRPSDKDRRSVVLIPTQAGRHILDRFSHGRADALSAAISQMPATDRAVLTICVPVLTDLMERLEQIAGDAPDWPAEEHTAI